MSTASQPTATVTATVPPPSSASATPKPQQSPNAKIDPDGKLANLSSKRDASWPSVLFYIHLNILGLYGIMVLFTNAYLTTVIFTAFLSFIGIIGVTCGAHRLFAHRTYEANTFLKLFLVLCQTMAGQVSDQFRLVWKWNFGSWMEKKKKKKKKLQFGKILANWRQRAVTFWDSNRVSVWKVPKTPSGYTHFNRIMTRHVGNLDRFKWIEFIHWIH